MEGKPQNQVPQRGEGITECLPLASCLVFLRLNGIEPAPDSEAWENLTLEVAASRLDRDAATARLRDLVS